MLPSPPLAVRMSPFGASVIPSGPLRSPPGETVKPGVPSREEAERRVGDRLDPAVHRVRDIEGSVTPESDASRPDDERGRVGLFRESRRDHVLVEHDRPDARERQQFDAYDRATVDLGPSW